MGLNIDQMTQIDNIQLVDASGNLAVIKPASTAAVATDTSLVVALSPNTALPTGANVIGAVTQSGTWNIGTLTTLTSITNPVAVTQSGTWNLNNISGTISLPTGAATSALQTTGNTSLSTIATTLTLAQGSTTSGQTGSLQFGAVTTAAPTYTTAQSSPFSLTTAGALRVDGSGATQPVSGSVSVSNFPATQPVSGTVTANQGTSPWIVAGGGTAGVSGTAVLTIQGIAGGTAVPISGSITATNPSVSATASAPPSSATYIGGSVTTAAPTYTTGQMDPLSLTTAGALRVDASATTQPVSGTVTANQGTSPWIVQDNASNTSAATAAARGLQVMGVFNTTPTTLTTGQSGFLQLDPSQNLLVNIKALPLDTTPATQNVTAADVGSTVTNGANTMPLVTGTPTAGSAATFAVASLQGGKVQVTGTWTGTIQGEVSMDGGTTWAVTVINQVGSYGLYNSPYFTGNFVGTVDLSGITNFRMRAVTAWTGTATVRLLESTSSHTGFNVQNPIKLLDQFNGTLATIKAGNTAAIATDTALVVAISPNNTIPVQTPAVAASGALGALNARVQLAIGGQASAGMQLYAGTLIGTIVPNISYDGGTTWEAVYWQDSATGQLFGNFTFASANPAEGKYFVIPPGTTNVSVVVTAYTSGTANVTIVGSTATGKSTLFEGISGNPPPPTILQVGAVAATSAPSLANGDMYAMSLTLAGALRVDGSAVTQPISAASLPLPTGAATSANQSTEITSLQTIDNSSGPVAAGTAATASWLTGGVFNTTQPTLTNTQQAATQLTARGAVIVATGVDALDVTPPTLTKGTQGATGFSVQNLHDAGRNVSNFYMATQTITTATDALQSLTGYKSGAAVGATTTPAVVTAAKTYRITSITMTYVAVTTAGTVEFTLRANTGGTVVIGSPAVMAWTIGGPSATAGVTQTVSIPIPDGLEFAAGTGIGISMVGRGATGTATAVGYGQIAIYGYEY